MKICSKCGVQQSSDRVFCVDCDNKLGDSISDIEKQKIETETKNKIDKMNEETYQPNVSAFDKIVGFVSLLGLITTIIFMILYKKNVERVPETIYTILFFAISLLFAFFPKAIWAVEKFRLSFTINNYDDAEPSGFYLFMRKALVVCCFIFAIILLIVTIINLINPPEVNPVFAVS